MGFFLSNTIKEKKMYDKAKVERRIRRGHALKKKGRTLPKSIQRANTKNLDTLLSDEEDKGEDYLDQFFLSRTRDDDQPSSASKLSEDALQNIFG